MFLFSRSPFYFFCTVGLPFDMMSVLVFCFCFPALLFVLRFCGAVFLNLVEAPPATEAERLRLRCAMGADVGGASL